MDYEAYFGPLQRDDRLRSAGEKSGRRVERISQATVGINQRANVSTHRNRWESPHAILMDIHPRMMCPVPVHPFGGSVRRAV